MIERMQWLKSPEAQIVEKIISAFPDTPPPSDQNIVCAEMEHLKKCDDCRNAQHFFAGKIREDILADEQNYPHLVNAFDFFTPETWHYYLPVFLIQDLIRQRHCFDRFWNYSQPGIIDEHWSKRIELMSDSQCEALIEYLEFYRPYALEFGQIEELSRILEWWQGIYQEKLSTMPKRI